MEEIEELKERIKALETELYRLQWIVSDADAESIRCVLEGRA